MREQTKLQLALCIKSKSKFTRNCNGIISKDHLYNKYRRSNYNQNHHSNKYKCISCRKSNPGE